MFIIVNYFENKRINAARNVVGYSNCKCTIQYGHCLFRKSIRFSRPLLPRVMNRCDYIAWCAEICSAKNFPSVNPVPQYSHVITPWSCRWCRWKLSFRPKVLLSGHRGHTYCSCIWRWDDFTCRRKTAAVLNVLVTHAAIDTQMTIFILMKQQQHTWIEFLATRSFSTHTILISPSSG